MVGIPTSRGQRLLAWIEEADEDYSKPVFASSLPFLLEAVFSLPANWFGLTPILLVGPLWTGLLLAPQVAEEFNARLFLAAVVLTIPLLVAWYIFLFTGNQALFTKIFVGKQAITISPIISVGICYCLIDNPTLFSMCVYPLWLWPSSIILVLLAKNRAKRARPCTKPKYSEYILNKHFRSIPLILAGKAGDASFPSGDVAGAMAFGLTIALSGRTDVGSTIVVLACLGRVYYVVHHVLDTVCGALITLFVHVVSSELLGLSISRIEWFHPILMHCCFSAYFLMMCTKLHSDKVAQHSSQQS